MGFRRSVIECLTRFYEWAAYGRWAPWGGWFCEPDWMMPYAGGALSTSSWWDADKAKGKR